MVIFAWLSPGVLVLWVEERQGVTMAAGLRESPSKECDLQPRSHVLRGWYDLTFLPEIAYNAFAIF